MDLRNQFTGYAYMLIHLANCMGWDKEVFSVRLLKARAMLEDIAAGGDREEWMQTADSPHQARQAIREIQYVKQGHPTGLMVDFDATNQFLQIMSALIGCKKSAYACNLLDPDSRVDGYLMLSDIISEAMPHLNFTRQQAKDLFMKSLAYGSEEVPRALFQQEEDMNHYLELMEEHFPGVMIVRNILLSLWDSNAMYHTWVLPDGHTAHVPVRVTMKGDNARIEIAEAGEFNNGVPKSITFVHKEHRPSDYNTPILANVIQSLDGWLVRTVRQRCAAEGIQIATIHDCMRSHANHMGAVRHHYREALAELAESDYLHHLRIQLKGDHRPIRKLSNNLATDIRNSCYALC